MFRTIQEVGTPGTGGVPDVMFTHLHTNLHTHYWDMLLSKRLLSWNPRTPLVLVSHITPTQDLGGAIGPPQKVFGQQKTVKHIIAPRHD